MLNRGKAVPGGTCGFWGACGAGISAGMFVSILSGATPLTEESWGLSNQMTSKALEAISRTDGPRCCKRDSYLAILAAVDFVKNAFWNRNGMHRSPVYALCSEQSVYWQALSILAI